MFVCVSLLLEIRQGNNKAKQFLSYLGKVDTEKYLLIFM